MPVKEIEKLLEELRRKCNSLQEENYRLEDDLTLAELEIENLREKIDRAK